MDFRYVTASEGQIDPADRGLAYGDGLFETMAVRSGRIRYLDLHLDRLRTGAARLALPLPDADDLSARLHGEIGGIARGTLKLILTRGSGPRAYAPPPRPVPTIVLLLSPGGEPAGREIAVASLETRLAENVKLAGIKHLNRLEQVLARLELTAHAADEGLMSSTGGQVICGISRNLFAVHGQRLLTPDLRLAGVRGVLRRAVLEASGRLGIDAVEVELRAQDLLEADEIFMTNALVGVQSVAALDGREFKSRAVADRLRSALGLDHDA